MIEERQILEAMLNSTAEQCRAAGELFLALADRPRDIHFKADLQRRLDTLPPAISGSLAMRLPDTRVQAIMDATSRSQVMREHISTMLYRRGLSLPDGDATLPINESGPFVTGVESKLVHARRISLQLPSDFPGRGKYDPPANPAATA